MEKLLKKLSVAGNLVGNLYCYLITDSLKTVYFAHFQSLLQSEIISCSSPTNLHKALLKQNGKIKVTLELKQMTFCGEKFKKLPIITVPMLYILRTMMFVVRNPDKHQTNVSNHSRDTRQKTDFFYNQ
jgi:hypothetical protein